MRCNIGIADKKKRWSVVPFKDQIMYFFRIKSCFPRIPAMWLFKVGFDTMDNTNMAS